MEDQTEIISKPAADKKVRQFNHESQFLGMSLRGCIAIIFALGLCAYMLMTALAAWQQGNIIPPIDSGIMTIIGGVFGAYFQKLNAAATPPKP